MADKPLSIVDRILAKRAPAQADDSEYESSLIDPQEVDELEAILAEAAPPEDLPAPVSLAERALAKLKKPETK